MYSSLRMLPRAARAFPRSTPPRTPHPMLFAPITRSFKATSVHSLSSSSSNNNNNNSTPPNPSSSSSSTPQPPQPHPLPEFDLTSHTILITGGARGLGLTFASSLLNAGATIYALDRLHQPSPDFLSLQQSYTTPRLHYRQIDVRDSVALNEVIAAIADHEGRIDGLIAAAGIQQETPALEYSAEDANRMLAVNVTGVLVSAQAVARQMIRLKDSSSSSSSSSPSSTCSGSILLIASMSASITNRDLPCCVYNASKAAVVQLARSLAAEWGPHGIRVNSLSPGYVRTEMVQALFERMPERREKWAKENMMGRVSGVDDYRGVVVFAMSGRASGFMTGADLRIDGGHSAW